MTTTAVTYNGAIPAQPQAINTAITINSDRVLVDLTMQLAQGKISGIQTIFVDLMNHLGDVYIYMPDTGQRICAKAQTQGYYPILSTNLMKFEISSDTNGKFPIQFINFPIASGVWGFNVLKGDKGDDGAQGLNGGLVTTINSDYPDGETISEEFTDPDTNEQLIVLKKLVAGDGMEIIDNGEFLELINLGGGGGGTPTPSSSPDYIKLMVSPFAGGTILNAGELNYLDLSGALVVASRGATFAKSALGVQFNSAGLYQVSINFDSNADAGILAIKSTVASTDYTAHATIDNSTIGINLDSLILNYTDQFNFLGMPELDVIKIACCNLSEIVDNYILNITIVKIG